ncbi:MAG: hypothetical protein JNG82_13005 [Opitutaceae bacterium]|nr:hypothetical protein [Opitutaceae bacterium]
MESAVSRAFPKRNGPAFLADSPELFAPLARGLAAELWERLFKRRELEARVLEAQLIEQTYDRIGSVSYRCSREAMEAAQWQFLELYRDPADSPERRARQVGMERAQEVFQQTRHEHAPAVRDSVAKDLFAHWSSRPMNRLPDTLFANAPFASSASRLARIHPVWWGSFFGRMQVSCKKGHPAHGELLDALPELIKESGCCTIEGAVYEWRKSRNDYWGWYGAIHPWVTGKRTARKATTLVNWYQRHAPKFLADAGDRQRLHERLVERLAAVDPWGLSASHSPDRFAGMHGRN